MNTALITGASSGIGKELAKIHAGNKGNLILVARSVNKLNQIKNELEAQFQVQVWVLGCDLTQPGAPQRVFDFVNESRLEVDFLINNAGFGDFGFFHKSDWKKQQQMIELNITALTHLCYLFIPKMIEKKRGKILNVASVAAFQPGPLMSVYYATKAYVLSFSEALNNELKDYGITVTTLCPGPVRTGFQDAAQLGNSKLFNLIKPINAYPVAFYGYNAMLKGKSVAIQGLFNKLLMFGIRLIPRKWVVNMVRQVQNFK